MARFGKFTFLIGILLAVAVLEFIGLAGVLLENGNLQAQLEELQADAAPDGDGEQGLDTETPSWLEPAPEEVVEKEPPAGELTAAEILALFLKEQKKEILGSKKTLTAATYEYAFANPKNMLLKKRFSAGVTMLEKLIRMGTQSEEFYDVDARIAAKNIMYVLEGLKIASVTMGVSGETIDNELYMIMQGLVIEE